MSAVNANRPPLPPVEPLSCYGTLKAVIEVIIQVAVRLFFIYLCVAIAALLLPLTFHAIVLPIVALSATFLAGLFYQKVDFSPEPTPTTLLGNPEG